MPQEKIDLLKRTVAKGTDNDQFELFLSVCQRHGLDPFVKQVYCVLWPISKHHQDEKGIWLPGHDMVIITGIGGYRKMAARDHRDYAGSSDAEYTWFDPPRKTPAGREIPRSATVRVHRRGAEDTIATVYWEEFAPGDLTDKRADFWNRTPKNQLEKCAEAKGLRKAFPGLGDVFTEEEMSQRLQDITAGGREIVQSDGMSPSGRPLTYEARMAANLPEVTEGVPRGGSREAAQEVLKSKLGAAKSNNGEKTVAGEGVSKPTAPSVPPSAKPPDWKFAGSITLDYTKSDILVTGDVQELFAAAPQCMRLFKWGADGFWYVKLADTTFIRQRCVEINFEIREIRPAKSSAPQRHEQGGKTTAEGGSSGKPKSGTAAPAVVMAGTIERTNMGMAGKAPVKYVTLLMAGKKKAFLGCFHKSLWDDIEAGLGKLAAFVVVTKGEYHNIEKIRQIGSKEWDEDGTPVVQRKDQEAGQKTLY